MMANPEKSHEALRSTRRPSIVAAAPEGAKVPVLDEAQRALLALGEALRAAGYTFVTVTPETHRRVLSRRGEAIDARDVFGWSRPFRQGVLPAAWVRLMEEAGVLESDGAWRRATVRFSTLGPYLLVHSAYPTTAADAVFFGPDTYRFCAWLQRQERRCRGRVVDVGAGTGAGGFVAGGEELVLADVNAGALRLAAVNAVLAGRPVELVRSDVLRGVEGDFDLIVANPPYIADEGARTYRDGGGALGAGLSVRLVVECLPRLRPGGQLLVYTGSAVVGGRHLFRDAVTPALEGWEWSYEELDPDVFGEELERPAYADAERIAVVGLRVSRGGSDPG